MFERENLVKVILASFIFIFLMMCFIPMLPEKRISCNNDPLHLADNVIISMDEGGISSVSWDVGYASDIGGADLLAQRENDIEMRIAQKYKPLKVGLSQRGAVAQDCSVKISIERDGDTYQVFVG